MRRPSLLRCDVQDPLALVLEVSTNEIRPDLRAILGIGKNDQAFAALWQVKDKRLDALVRARMGERELAVAQIRVNLPSQAHVTVGFRLHGRRDHLGVDILRVTTMT